jgi:O-antigen/teichoic acid export membrane protein
MGTQNSNLKQQTVSGVSWTMLAQILTQTASFIVSVILARLLTPADFGLMAMISVFVGFATLIAKAGFGQALVQRLQVEDRHYTSAFWMNMGVGAGMTLLMCLASPLIATFYKEPRLVPLTIAISVVFLLGPANLVQRTILQRTMNFRRIGLIRIISATVAGVSATVMAFAGFGVWSLVALNILDALCDVVLMWWTTEWHPRLAFEWQAVKELLGFSLNFTGYSTVEYWARNADNMLIGRFMGPALLGIYARSYSLMLLPITQIFSVVSQVMYAAMAQIQDQLERVRRAYLKGTGLVALVTVPMMLGLFAVAAPFVGAIYGPKWTEMVPIVRYLCFVGLLRSITITGKWIYQSQARVDIMFRWEMVKTVVTLAGFALGIYLGDLVTFVQIFLAVTVALFYFDLLLPLRVIRMPVTTLLRSLGGIVFCALVMTGLVYGLDQLVTGSWSDWPRLLVNTAFGAGVYVLGLHLLQVEAYKELAGIAVERWQQVYRKKLARTLG